MTLFLLILSSALVLNPGPSQCQEYVKWAPLTEAQEKYTRLVHGNHLLLFAAPAGSSIRVEHTKPQQTIIVQVSANVMFDCSPWLKRFGGTTSTWLEKRYVTGPNYFIPNIFPEFKVQSNFRRIINSTSHTLTIVSAINTIGASNPDYGRYTCEVCAPTGDGVEECHRSSTVMFVAGRRPKLNKGRVDDIPIIYSYGNIALKYYHIGTEICIDRTIPARYIIKCNAIGYETHSIKIQWKKDKHIVVGRRENSFRRDFFSAGSGYEILNPYVVNPPVLQLLSPLGNAFNSLSISTVTNNISWLAPTLSPTLTSQELRSMAVDAVLGEWSCEYSNVYGTDTATSRIKQCELEIKIDKTSANILGETAIFIETSIILLPSDKIVCKFGPNDVEAQIMGRYSAVCASPRVEVPGTVPFKVLVNDQESKQQLFTHVSPEKGHAISLSSKQQTLLFTSGDLITLTWNPELLVPSSLVNNITVDISIFYQDYDGEIQHTDITILDQLETSSLNDGEARITLQNYSLACSTGNKGVTFTVCPIYFKVSVSSDQYLPSDMAVWSGTVYYRSRHVSDFDMLDQCENWRQDERSHLPLLERLFQQSEPCPPTSHIAGFDQTFLLEDRRSIFTGNNSYQQLFQNYFHPKTTTCFRLSWPDPQGYGQQCCYGNDGILVKKPTGGSVDLVSPIREYHRHVLNDLLPYILCCKGETFAQCDKYFEARPEGSEVGYVRLNRGFLFGDPHILTLDGYQYTFNGKGEFVLIQTLPRVFSLQGRMEQPIDADGSSALGTVFTAIVAKQHTSNTTVQFQVNSNDSSLMMLLNGVKVDFDDISVLEFEDVAIFDKGNNSVQAIFSSRASVEVSMSNNMLSSIAVALPESLKGTTSGLMGNFNGTKSDDLKPRKGNTVISIMENPEAIHKTFGITWIVSDSSDSLFTYVNDSWSTYYSPDFAPVFNATFTNSTLKALAMEKCKDSKLCLFDAATTGRLEVGITTMEEQTKISEIEEAFSSIDECNPICQNGVCMKNNTCKCSDGFQGDRCTIPDIKDCGQSNPCQNNGSCSVQALTFTCKCPPGFQGTLCEERKEPDFGINILNGTPRVNGNYFAIDFKSTKPAMYLCVLDSILHIPCSSGVVRLRLSNGVHSFTIHSYTDSGDYSTATRRLFIGSCSINLINGGVSVEGSNAVVEFGGSRDISKMQCVLDDLITCR